MKDVLKLACIIATSTAIISCSNATPDKKEVAKQCEQMVNEKLVYEGKVTRDIDIIKDGGGLVILSMSYGYENTSYDERSIYCGSNGTTVAINNKLSELQAVLNL
ncbi:hypothetical protein [Shewanella frigidimarina]|uniref:hypothetical protein n=1 Tax=Shewanella frigidimarina TaxID=56812 RepID=UPI003D7BB28E